MGDGRKGIRNWNLATKMSDEQLDIIDTPDGLLADVQSMIEQTRAGVAQAVNAGMTSLYWRIGKRSQSEILRGQRADYGKEIVRYAVATMGEQIWNWLLGNEPSPHDSLC